MVVWGLEIYSSWLLPATSLLLSVSFLLGRLPAEMLTGAVYALISRPFEIGDKIRLARPGWKTHESSPIYWCVVKDQDLMHTHLIAQNGETMIIENYVLRQLLVTNVTRSSSRSWRPRAAAAGLPSGTKPAPVGSSCAGAVSRDFGWADEGMACSAERPTSRAS